MAVYQGNYESLKHKKVALTLAFVCFTACATPVARDAPTLCGTPTFAYEEGWLGGDAAYSVPLSSGKTLWLFGDTFVGKPGQVNRIGSAFIHNSIGISQCRAGEDWTIDYFWSRATADQEPKAFFYKGTPEQYWWLFDGFVHDGVLYVGLLIVEKAPPRGPLQLPMRILGMDLARVANPEAPPSEWETQVIPLWRGETAVPGSAMVVHEQHLYLFTFLDIDAVHHPRVLARLPLDALGSQPTGLQSQIEYLSKEETWKPGLVAADAKVLMDDNASEMSVHFHPELQSWVAVYSYPHADPNASLDVRSDQVFLRTSRHLEGPWSEPTAVYRVDEMQASYPPGNDPNTLCYAAKEHPELARKDSIVITYVCNLFTPVGEDPYAVLARLLRRMDLYRPRVVTLPLLRAPAAVRNGPVQVEE